MDTKLCEGYRIVKNGGTISVTNTENWAIDTTVGRPKDIATETGEETEAQKENK